MLDCLQLKEKIKKIRKLQIKIVSELENEKPDTKLLMIDKKELISLSAEILDSILIVEFLKEKISKELLSVVEKMRDTRERKVMLITESQSSIIRDVENLKDDNLDNYELVTCFKIIGSDSGSTFLKFKCFFNTKTKEFHSEIAGLSAVASKINGLIIDYCADLKEKINLVYSIKK